MKKSNILPLLLGSTLVFAACGGNEEAKKSEDTKTETAQKSEVTDAKSLIEKANEAGKDIKSYKADLETDMSIGSESAKMTMNMSVDEDETTKAEIKAEDQTIDMYIFDEKTVLSQDGETFMDATDSMGAEVKDQLKNMDYQSNLKTLDAYKDAKFEKTDDGYELEKSFKNFDEYKQLIEDSGASTADLNEDEIDSIKGTMKISFDKDFLMSGAEQDMDMTTADGDSKIETDVEYEDFNKVSKIEIPEAAKNAE